jgi:hypothetical protein
MTDARIETALYLRYKHSLLLSLLWEFGFQVEKRSPYITFDETRPHLDLSLVKDPQTGLCIGDAVTVHSALICPWSPAVDVPDHATVEDIRIIAFVDLSGKAGKNLLSARFAVLAKDIGAGTINRYPCIMTGSNGKEKIALFFLEALEKMPRTSFRVPTIIP